MSMAVRIGRLRRRKDQSLQNPSIGLITRLADHFGVTLTYLVGEDVESPEADRDLQRMFRQAAKLDKREREILDDMVQSLLKRRTRH
jgi:transcriptional regulator with XRE-family HTH domain